MGQGPRRTQRSFPAHVVIQASGCDYFAFSAAVCCGHGLGRWPQIAAVVLASALSPPAQLISPPPGPVDVPDDVAAADAIPVVTKATASFDPPVVRPGEEAFLRVVLNALEESIEWPTNLAGPPQLEIRPGAHGQMLQSPAPTWSRASAFNYRVRASSPGAFTVPEFVVKVDGKPVTVPAAQLQVVSEPPPDRPPAVQLMLELPVTNLFVGQAVQARVVLPGAPGSVVQGLGAAPVERAGLPGGPWARLVSTSKWCRTARSTSPAFIYETTLVPMMAGKTRPSSRKGSQSTAACPVRS